MKVRRSSVGGRDCLSRLSSPTTTSHAHLPWRKCCDPDAVPFGVALLWYLLGAVCVALGWHYGDHIETGCFISVERTAKRLSGDKL